MGPLGKENPSGLSYGAFVGYNVQFSDVLFGVDFHYNRSGFAAGAPVTPISRVVIAGGIVYDVTVEGNANMRITDYGAARLRAGWILGNFLPYGTVGLALGRANVQRPARVYGVENPATTALSLRLLDERRQERGLPLWLGGRWRHGHDDNAQFLPPR